MQRGTKQGFWSSWKPSQLFKSELRVQLHKSEVKKNTNKPGNNSRKSSPFINTMVNSLNGLITDKYVCVCLGGGGGVHYCWGLLLYTFSPPAARGCTSAFISVVLTLIGVCVLWLRLSLNCHAKPPVSLYDLHSPHFLVTPHTHLLSPHSFIFMFFFPQLNLNT